MQDISQNHNGFNIRKYQNSIFPIAFGSRVLNIANAILVVLSQNHLYYSYFCKILSLVTKIHGNFFERKEADILLLLLLKLLPFFLSFKIFNIDLW